MIVHRGSQWILYTRNGKHVLGRHPSKAAAERQERAVEASKHRHDGRKPLPRSHPPLGIARDYARNLLRRVRFAGHALHLTLQPVVKQLSEREDSGPEGSLRLDAAKGARAQVQAAVDRAARASAKVFSDGPLKQLTRNVANATSTYQRAQLSRQVQSVLGVDLPKSEPHLAPALTSFVETNVALIKSVPKQLHDQVAEVVGDGILDGKRWEEISKDLAERLGVAESRAKLIARDQVGKLFGDVNKARQESLGVKAFIWRTVNDERVRPEHEELEGEQFDWDDPPDVEGEGVVIPGQAVNCRCYSEPIIEDPDNE